MTTSTNQRTSRLRRRTDVDAAASAAKRSRRRRTIGYSIWETAEALAASEESGNHRAQIAKLGDVLAEPPNRDQYELTVLA